MRIDPDQQRGFAGIRLPGTARPSLTAHGSPTGVSVAEPGLALSVLGLRAADTESEGAECLLR